MSAEASDGTAPERMAAIAHPNVAIVKYWGKQVAADGAALDENLPASPSLSIAIGALATRTVVRAASEDELRINGKATSDAKVASLVAEMRRVWQLPPLVVSTCNDFPTGAGLASSASGFAALVIAIDGAFALGLSASERSVWARRGSASAARSVVGGFAELASGEGDEWAASPVLGKDAWPLEVVVAIVSEEAKRVPSSLGMENSRRTSPFYSAWIESTHDDFAAARQAVLGQDFEALSAIAESSCLKLHALMLSTRPALLYWHAATLACIATVRRLQERGTPVFFTIDAGPQVKAVCIPGHGDAVAAALTATPGVVRVLRSGIGDGARCVDPGALA